MGAEPGRRFLRLPAAKLEPVIVVYVYWKTYFYYNKSLRSTVVKVKMTPTFQPTDSRLSSGQMATRAREH